MQFFQKQIFFISLQVVFNEMVAFFHQSSVLDLFVPILKLVKNEPNLIYNKFSITNFTNNSDEFYHLFPLIVVINSDSTFDCDGDCTRLFHLRHNTSYKVWVFH